MSDSKLCIFCGRNESSREHIVSKWILNDLGLYQIKTKLGFGNQIKTGEMDEIMETQPLGSFVTDSVCRQCNNNWMSELERQVKPLLSPLMVDPWPPDDRAILSGLFVYSPILARWLTKTACTFGEKMSVPVPDAIRSDLYNGRMHPEVVVDISCNEQCGTYIGMSRTWKGVVDGKPTTVQIKGLSFRFVWQLRHLAMRVSFFPAFEKRMIEPRFPVAIYPQFKVPKDYTSYGVTKPRYRYDTLQQLEHETFFEQIPSRWY